MDLEKTIDANLLSFIDYMLILHELLKKSKFFGSSPWAEKDIKVEKESRNKMRTNLKHHTFSIEYINIQPHSSSNSKKSLISINLQIFAIKVTNIPKSTTENIKNKFDQDGKEFLFISSSLIYSIPESLNQGSAPDPKQDFQRLFTWSHTKLTGLKVSYLIINDILEIISYFSNLFADDCKIIATAKDTTWKKPSQKEASESVPLVQLDVLQMLDILVRVQIEYAVTVCHPDNKADVKRIERVKRYTTKLYQNLGDYLMRKGLLD
ncbi:hypothetical protein BpHYR1_040088 [Brachionus plicatilis]|uniref:Uncharacterized protein n=1 Tax=Brachionus plicatilis TaxID=10195 RepID=A0A3M7S4N9_BRAPC|nr:hypothetical protein BpHYR1_040088 [Brachionus plicatilis]